MSARFLTLGHGQRPIEAFLARVREHGVSLVADIRTLPRSRTNPQFASEALAAALRGEGIEYVHLPGLGGLRRPRPDSANGAWQNASFRGYADYMQTPAFEAGLADLLVRAGSTSGRVALVCAESLPWRCHRSLVADALLARGVAVDEIVGDQRLRAHTLTPWARVQDGRVWYPAPAQAPPLDGTPPG